MKITHSDAVSLEHIVRRAHDNCDRSGMAGYIDADHFERKPFDAALIALSVCWKRINVRELDDFLNKWEYFLCEESENANISEYIEELNDLVGS